MLQRLNRTLGRAVYRTVGLIAGLLALAAFRAGWSALGTGEGIGTLVLALVGVACGAFAWWCFRPERRLSDIE